MLINIYSKVVMICALFNMTSFAMEAAQVESQEFKECLLALKSKELKKASELLFKVGAGDSEKLREVLSTALASWLNDDERQVFFTPKVVKLFREAAKRDPALGSRNQGILFECGLGVEKNNERAARLYRRSAKQGNSYGQCNLGLMYLAGKGVDRNLNKALKYLRLSVEQENPVGMSNLGTLYMKGDIIDQNYQEGLKLYQSAASKGLPGAWYNLGNSYYYGIGVERNITTAAEFFRLAAKQGFSKALEMLEEIEKSELTENLTPATVPSPANYVIPNNDYVIYVDPFKAARSYTF